MNLDEMKSRWREQQLALADRQFDDLLANVRSQAEQFEAKILRRDRIEAGAALFVAAFFAMSLWKLDMPPVMAVGIVICMVAALQVSWTLRWTRLRDPQPAPDAPLVEFTRMTLTRLDRQIVMLRNVTWWYTLPLLSGVAVALGGILWGIPELPVATSAIFSIAFLLCLILAGFIVYRINQTALNRELLPRRRQLQELLQALNESDEAPMPSDAQDRE